MPYTPQAPPLIRADRVPPDANAGSPTSEKPVTPVTAVTHLLSMTLQEFEEHGQPLQVRVTGLPETIWFVPREADIEGLAQRDIERGRIWTAGELRALWGGGSGAHENAISLARIKMAVSAEVVSVENLIRAGGSDVGV